MGWLEVLGQFDGLRAPAGGGGSGVELTDAQWEVVRGLIPEPPRRADGWGRPWRSASPALEAGIGLAALTCCAVPRLAKLSGILRLRSPCSLRSVMAGRRLAMKVICGTVP